MEDRCYFQVVWILFLIKYYEGSISRRVKIDKGNADIWVTY